VSVELMKSFSMPIVLYGLEVTDPKKSTYAMLNNLMNRAVYKMFNASDTNVIQEVGNFLGLYDIELFCEERRSKFLKKANVLSHTVLNTLVMQTF